MLKGKVAEILDNRTIAINIGLKDGVELGYKFKILSIKSKPVLDPDTGEELGSLNVEKTKVRVIKVEDKFSIAETYEYETINEGGTMSSISSFYKLMQPPKLVRKYETLNIEEGDKVELTEAESKVKKGDIVEQIDYSNKDAIKDVA